MIKEDLICAVSHDTRYNKELVSEVINAVFENIARILSEGGKVKLSGFGTFEPTRRAARTGRNIHANEAVPIPPRVMPVFRPSEKLRSKVNNEFARR